MNDEIQFPDTPFPLGDRFVFLGRRGSEAHGTYAGADPSDPHAIDDRDLMGVVIQPPSGYLGLRHWESAESIKGVWDVVLYDVRKFVGLLCKQNPNVLSMLFLREQDFLVGGDCELVRVRELFQARQPFYEACVGYARGQFHRMTHHQGDPKRGFMGEKRKKLVERFGYDTKNAAHMIRLLRMGQEFLRTGRMTVYRKGVDADELIAIKRGRLSLDEVSKLADLEFAECDKALRQSAIREAIDRDAVEAVLVQMIREHWDRAGPSQEGT